MDSRTKKYILTLVMSLAILLILIFSVINTNTINLIDNDIAKWTYTLRNDYLNAFMIGITDTADYIGVITILILSSIFFYLKKTNQYSIILLISIVLNYGLVYIAKILIHRNRPSTEFALVNETSFSFPSGHSIMAIVFFGLLFFFLISFIRNNGFKLISTLFAIIFILLVGFSRVYLGVHWPTDVLASFAIGTVYLSILAIINQNKTFILRKCENTFIYNSIKYLLA